MKTGLFFWISITLLSICCWSGCDQDAIENFDRAALCTYRDSISAPPGYSIKFIDTLPKPVNTDFFLFLDDQLGFALARGKNSYVDVLKTTDGGYHWMDLKVDDKEYARSMAFITPDIGVISLHDVTGCPNQCKHLCTILRTTDGGLNWSKLQIQNFKGTIRYLATDHEIFFGILSYDNDETLVWSNNNGITWDTFPNLGISFEHVEDIQIFQDNIYVNARGKVYVIDLQGQLLKVMSIPEDFNSDLKIISENEFILANFDSVMVTIDGFQSTRTIIKGFANLIGYSDLDYVVAVLNKSHCPTDTWQSNDLFAYSDDGGQTWTEGQLKTNLILEMRASHKVDEDRYIVLLNRSIYELRRM